MGNRHSSQIPEVVQQANPQKLTICGIIPSKITITANNFLTKNMCFMTIIEPKIINIE
jgi:hypothetical protein